MTPIQLIMKLCERIKNTVKDYLMEESDGDHDLRAPNVWAQELPEKLYEDEPDPADYPFVLVVLGGGDGYANDELPCNVAILVAGYDGGQIIEGGVRDRQGWLLPAEMCWRIITALARDPIIGAFKLDIESLSWELPEQEQPAPQWFGIINTRWSTPLPKPNYNLSNMTNNTMLPSGASVETFTT